MAEEIGAVKIAIEGDFSPLEKDFQDAVAIAVSQGKTLAEAIQAAMPTLDTSPVTDALMGIGEAAALAGEQLALFGADEEQIPFAEMSGQMNMFATQLEEVGAAESQVTQETEQSVSWFDKLRGSIMDSVKSAETAGDSYKGFADGVGNFISHPLKVAGDSVKSFLLEMGPIGGIALGAASALALLGKGALDLVSDFGAAAESTQNLADRLNITWTQTRELQEMAAIAGVDINTLTQASRRLALAMEDSSGAGKKTAEALNKIGVTGRDSGELLVNFLQALSEIPDDTERIAVASTVLGKSSNAIIPLIKNYGDLQKALSDLGPMISEKVAGGLMKADDASDKLGVAWRRLKEQLAGALAPGITVFLDGLTKSIASAGLLFKTIKDGMLSLGAAMKAIALGIVGGTAAAANSIAESYIAAGGKIEASAKGLKKTLGGTPFDTEGAGKAGSEDRLRPIKELGDSLAVLVEREKQAQSAHSSMISEIAASGGTIEEFFTSKMDKAKRSLEEFNRGLENDTPLQSFDPMIQRTSKEMQVLADAINKANQEALDASGFGQLEQAFKDLGITSTHELEKMAEASEKNYQTILNSGEDAYELLGIAALKSVQAQIDLEVRLNVITREEWEKTTAQIQHDIGELDTTHARSTRTRGNNERTLARDLQQINHQLFNSISNEIARDIVEWKNWGDSLVNIGKEVAKSLIKAFLDVFLVPLENKLAKILTGGIPTGGGGGGGIPSIPGVGGAGGAGGAAAGAAGAGISGIVGMVTGAITAVSSVIGNFQMAGMNKSLDLIENYTRYLKIGLVEQGDSLLNDSHIIRNTLTDMMSFNWSVVATQLQNISVSLDKLVGNGGFGTGGTKARAAFGGAVDSSAAAVHIDLRGANLSGDLTDGQVRTAFDRGFRMSKLGGALRPGVFPQ